jgi:dienelactone hydrolase
VADNGNLIGYLYPVANANAPYVIILHGCSGYQLTENWSKDWARWLNHNGIGAFAIDSDTTRHKVSCANTADDYWSIRRVADAYSGLDYLIKNGHMGPMYVLGMSNGARVVLRAMDHVSELVYPHRFVAGFSLYANCRQKGGIYPFEFYAPTYEFIGTSDDASSYKWCVALEGTPNYHLKLYDGAYHEFDADQHSSIMPGTGWRIGPDYSARNDLRKRVVGIIKGATSAAN